MKEALLENEQLRKRVEILETKNRNQSEQLSELQMVAGERDSELDSEVKMKTQYIQQLQRTVEQLTSDIQTQEKLKVQFQAFVKNNILKQLCSAQDQVRNLHSSEKENDENVSVSPDPR